MEKYCVRLVHLRPVQLCYLEVRAESEEEAGWIALEHHETADWEEGDSCYSSDDEICAEVDDVALADDDDDDEEDADDQRFSFSKCIAHIQRF